MLLLQFGIENVFNFCLPLALQGIAVEKELELKLQYNGTILSPCIFVSQRLLISIIIIVFRKKQHENIFSTLKTKVALLDNWYIVLGTQ